MASTPLPVVSLGIVLCVYFLFATAYAGQGHPKSSMWCMVGDTMVEIGHNWTERCRQCTCNKDGLLCEGPKCDMPYNAAHELQCAEWADECCCAKLGCKLSNDTIVPLGGALPPDPTDPCKICTCEGHKAHKHCMIQECQFLPCFSSVKRPGQCCEECGD